MMPKNSETWRLETLTAAEAEDRYRFRALLRTANSSIPMLCLGLRLSAKGSEALSLASARHFRSIRNRVLPLIEDAFAHYPDEDLRAVTILRSNWIIPADQLNRYAAQKIVATLRTYLNRAGLHKSGEPFLGFLHGEFEPSAGRFILHFHALTTKRGAGIVSTLSGRWGFVRSSSGAAPIRTTPIRNRARQTSYLLQSFWPQRSIRMTKNGLKRDRTKQRISEPHHCAALQWLDRHTLGDLLIASNLWSRRARGVGPGRRLLFCIGAFSKLERLDSVKLAANSLLRHIEGNTQGVGGCNTARGPRKQRPCAGKTAKTAKTSQGPGGHHA